jgi:hypothetical protein
LDKLPLQAEQPVKVWIKGLKSFRPKSQSILAALKVAWTKLAVLKKLSTSVT